MTVYIEDCLIENFVVTYLIIKCVSFCFKITIKKSRLILSCLLAAVISTFYPLINLNSFLLTIFKLCVGFLITLIDFDKNHFIAKYLAFIFFTALYAGLNIMFYFLIYGTILSYDNFPTYILLFLLVLIYFMVVMCIKFARKKLAISNFVYKVKITNIGKYIMFNAFLDSGNTLLDEDLSPIFIINTNLFNRLYKDISFSDLLTKNFKNLKEPHYIKSAFAYGSGKLLVFCVDNLQIIENDTVKYEFLNAKLGISYSNFNKNFGCDMLLNINAFA